jgi:hypothetical protein
VIEFDHFAGRLSEQRLSPNTGGTLRLWPRKDVIRLLSILLPKTKSPRPALDRCPHPDMRSLAHLPDHRNGANSPPAASGSLVVYSVYHAVYGFFKDFSVPTAELGRGIVTIV